MSAFFDSIFDGAVDKVTWSWQMGKFPWGFPWQIDNAPIVSDISFSFVDWLDVLGETIHSLDSLLYKRSLESGDRMLFMNSDMLKIVSSMRGYRENNGIHSIRGKWVINIEQCFPNRVLVVNRNLLDAIKTGMYATIDVVDWDHIPDEYR